MKTKKQMPSLRPTLLATLILTMAVGAMTLLKPEVAQGKISVKSITPIIDRILADTGKKATKAKKAAVKATFKTKLKEKSSDNVYAYSNDGDDDWNFHDPELDRLSKEVEKHGNAISKYYESGEFKKVQEQLEAKGKEMEAFYQKPELKELQEKMEKASEEFNKNWGETPETKGMQEKMETLGNKLDTYYNSPDFRKMNEALETKYGVPHDRHYSDEGDEKYRAYQAELQKNIPADIHQAQAEIKATSTKMREHFRSPEHEKQRELMRTLGDSLRKAYHNPQMEQQKAEMHALSEKMRSYSHSPEIEKEKTELHEATAKMHAYMKTPDFKRRLEEYRKAHPRHYNWREFDEDRDKPEKPEKPEQPEKSDN